MMTIFSTLKSHYEMDDRFSSRNKNSQIKVTFTLLSIKAAKKQQNFVVSKTQFNQQLAGGPKYTHKPKF